MSVVVEFRLKILQSQYLLVLETIVISVNDQNVMMYVYEILTIVIHVIEIKIARYVSKTLIFVESDLVVLVLMKFGLDVMIICQIYTNGTMSQISNFHSQIYGHESALVRVVIGKLKIQTD